MQKKDLKRKLIIHVRVNLNLIISFATFLGMCECVVTALQRRPDDINTRAADMWSFAILLWELETREVPFAELSAMEVGMKVMAYRV